ncbi:unnamed protein product [Scytosiphon promiscuus]
MGAYGGEESLRPAASSGARRGSEDAGVIGTASLEVHCCAAAPGPANGPAMYEVVYTRGGWIWRTTHRYSEWLALKERLRTDFGARNLPDDRLFPQKEDVGAIVTKLLTSCQGCREGGGRPVGILEDRRRGLQTYFSLVLEEQRELWDSSPDVKSFFFPGPPTSYSAALSKRRSERLKEEKQKAKEAASAASMMASSLKSTLGSLFESTPPNSTSTTPSKSSSSSSSSNPFPSFARSTSAVSSSSAASPRRRSDDQASASSEAATAEATVAPRPRSVMNRLTAMKEQMPSLRDLLFDDAPPPSGSASGGSRASSHHGGGGSSAGSGRSGYPGGSRHNKNPPFQSNKPPSESGMTDPDGGMSEMGGSKHSSIVCE